MVSSRRLKFNEKVEVWDQMYEGSKTFNRLKEDETEAKQKKFTIPLLSEVKDQKAADLLYEHIRRKLDYDLLKECLKDRKFVGKYLSIDKMEVLIGKALISGDLEVAKELLELSHVHEGFERVCVSNAYFYDFETRGKRNFVEPDNGYEYLLIMTLIRQGDPQTITFALQNTPDNFAIGEVFIRDGDMMYSTWEEGKEVLEMTAEDRLLDCMPRSKILHSMFEPETPLSAILKNRDAFVTASPTTTLAENLTSLLKEADTKKSGSKDYSYDLDNDGNEKESETSSFVESKMKRTSKGGVADNIINRLLQAGADPLANRYQAFKVAARYGLIDELKVLLKTLQSMYRLGKRTIFQSHIEKIHIAITSHAAIENRFDVIDFVRTLMEKTTATQINNKSVSMQKRYPVVIQKSIEKLVYEGKMLICTHRYRIINGVYNLLVVKQDLDDIAEAKKKAGTSLNVKYITSEPLTRTNTTVSKFQNNESVFSKGLGSLNTLLVNSMGASAFSSTASVPNGAHAVKGKHTQFKGILTTNNVTNYNRAVQALFDPTAGGPSAKLVLNMASTANPSNNESDAASSSGSLRKFSTASSAGAGKAGALISKQMLYDWFTSIMYQNDFNGENVVMVLFALGLKQYFKPMTKKKKLDGAGSEASSEWGDSSVGGSENEDDDNYQSDAGSVRSEESDKNSSYSMSTGSILSGNKTSKRTSKARSVNSKTNQKRSRLSSVTDAYAYFQNIGTKVADQIQTKRGKFASSKQKIEALELASEFGSDKILHEMIDLVAPEVDKSVLKCVYIAMAKNKNETGKLLLNRITMNFDTILVELQQAKVDDEKMNKNLSGLSGTNNHTNGTNKFNTVTKQMNKSIRQQRDKKINFINAIQTYFSEVERNLRSNSNSMQVKKNVKMNKALNEAKVLTRSIRPSRVSRSGSVTESLFNLTEKSRRISRRMSRAFNDGLFVLSSKLKPNVKGSREKSDSGQFSQDSGQESEPQRKKNMRSKFSNLRKSLTESLHMAAFASNKSKTKQAPKKANRLSPGLRNKNDDDKVSSEASDLDDAIDVNSSVRGINKNGKGGNANNAAASSKQAGSSHLTSNKIAALQNSNVNSSGVKLNTKGAKANGNKVTGPVSSLDSFPISALDLQNSSEHNSGAASLLRNGTIAKKKFEMTNNFDEQEAELREWYSKYLENLLTFSLKFGSYDFAATVLDNKHINKARSKDVVLDVLITACIKSSKKKTTLRPIKILVNLIHQKFSDIGVSLEQVGRELVTVSVEREAETLENLTIAIEEIVAIIKPFFTTDDLMNVILLSLKQSKTYQSETDEWDYWPDLISLTYKHMTKGCQDTLDVVKERIKKEKLANNLIESVKNALVDIFSKHGGDSTSSPDNDFLISKSKSTRRRSSMGSMLGGIGHLGTAIASTGRRGSRANRKNR